MKRLSQAILCFLALIVVVGITRGADVRYDTIAPGVPVYDPLARDIGAQWVWHGYYDTGDGGASDPNILIPYTKFHRRFTAKSVEVTLVSGNDVRIRFFSPSCDTLTVVRLSVTDADSLRQYVFPGLVDSLRAWSEAGESGKIFVQGKS